MLISSVMVAELLFTQGYELYFLIGLLCVLILFVQGFLSYSVSYIVIISGLLLSYKNIQKAYFLYGSVILFFAGLLDCIRVLSIYFILYRQLLA